MATKYDFISSEEKFRLAKISKDGLWGLWNIDSKTEVVAPTWSREPKFEQDHIIIDTPRGVGLIGEDGKFILEPRFKNIYPQTKDRIIVKTIVCFKGLFDGNGNELLPYVYQDMDYITDDCIIVVYSDLCGIVDVKGNVRLPYEYEKLSCSYFNKCFLAKKNGKYGVFTYDLKELLPFEFDNICFFHNFIIIQKGDFVGLYDYNGKEVLSPEKYSYINPVTDKLYIVAKDGYKGIISNDGTVLFYGVYEDIDYIGNDCFRVCKEFKKDKGKFEYKWGVINSKGEIIIPFECNSISERFVGEIVIVYKDSGHGCINKQGEVIIEPKYSIIMHEESDEYIKVCIRERTTKRWGLFDLKGNQLTPIIYDFIHTVKNQDGTIDVEYEGKQGVVML